MISCTGMRARTVLAMTLLIFNPMCTVAHDLNEPIVLMWQVTADSYKDFKLLKSFGVNTVQSFALDQQKTDYVSAYLNEANAAGLGVIPFVGNQEAGKDCVLAGPSEAFVKEYSGHPAIAAWHSVDEPAGNNISKECQRKVYARIKELDPKHPVFVSINFARQSDYDEYFAEDAFDALDLHKYVNPAISAPQRQLVELFKKNKRRNYPVILTLRAFNGPAGGAWRDLQPGSLRTQYVFAKTEAPGPNIGFYGWRLDPNNGISQIAWLRGEFEEVAKEMRVR